MTTEINGNIVKEYGLNAGATVVGIATSEDFSSAPKGFKPTDRLKGCRSVIVLGAPFTQESLLNSADEYTEVRKGMVKKMGDVAKEVAKLIKSDGFKAMAIPSASNKISLKHAAELAGLGIINRNYLLTNPEYGNLLWFSAVLTDAELSPDKKAQYTICDNCNKCVEICPMNSLDNLDSFGRDECSRNSMKLANRKFTITCFECRKVCPNRFGE